MIVPTIEILPDGDGDRVVVLGNDSDDYILIETVNNNQDIQVVNSDRYDVLVRSSVREEEERFREFLRGCGMCRVF